MIINKCKIYLTLKYIFFDVTNLSLVTYFKIAPIKVDLEEIKEF